MTNRSKSYQNSCVIETGLFDFHKMTMAILWFHLPKLGPQIINYRDYEWVLEILKRSWIGVFQNICKYCTQPNGSSKIKIC